MLSDDQILMPLLLQLALIATNAIFACAEIAIITMNENKLIKLSSSGDKRAQKLVKLTSQPARFLATIQVGITLAGFLGSAFAADNFSDKLVQVLLSIGVQVPEPTLDTLAVVFITLILSYFTLVLGELVPKRIAMRKAETLALSMAGFVSFIAKVAAPLVWLLTVSTNGILRALGFDPHAQDEEVTEEEIRMMIDAGSERGAIHPQEKEMIENVFEFNNKTAGEVMTHRTEVSLLWLDESLSQWEQTIYESKHSIYPICKETVDNIVGALYIKDYYRLHEKTKKIILSQAVKPAYFVPESVRADILFQNMRKIRNFFAIVLDEYGGMSGIITMNDLIEEIVGDLGDDNEEVVPYIERIDTGTWKVRGTAPLEHVAQQLGINLPDEEYDTFGGFVFGLLGNVPSDGSRPELEEYGLHIKVQEIREHRLETAVVCMTEKLHN